MYLATPIQENIQFKMHFQWIEIFIEMQSVQWIWFVKAIWCSEYKFLNNWTNSPTENRKVTHTLPTQFLFKKEETVERTKKITFNSTFICTTQCFSSVKQKYEHKNGIFWNFKAYLRQGHITTCGVLLETLLYQPLPHVIWRP